MPVRPDGRYKKPVKWMRQVNRDRALSNVPRQTHGDFRPLPQSLKNWQSFPCAVCETGTAWVTYRWRHKYGDNLPAAFLTCQDCKQKDRDEMAAVCKKINARKALMGIKKI